MIQTISHQKKWTIFKKRSNALQTLLKYRIYTNFAYKITQHNTNQLQFHGDMRSAAMWFLFFGSFFFQFQKKAWGCISKFI